MKVVTLTLIYQVCCCFGIFEAGFISLACPVGSDSKFRTRYGIFIILNKFKIQNSKFKTRYGWLIVYLCSSPAGFDLGCWSEEGTMVLIWVSPCHYSSPAALILDSNLHFDMVSIWVVDWKKMCSELGFSSPLFLAISEIGFYMLWIRVVDWKGMLGFHLVSST